MKVERVGGSDGIMKLVKIARQPVVFFVTKEEAIRGGGFQAGKGEVSKKRGAYYHHVVRSKLHVQLGSFSSNHFITATANSILVLNRNAYFLGINFTGI